MTKKILLKWLDGQKAKALCQVSQQETAAFEALLLEKIKRSDFNAFAEYLLPRMTEIHDKLEEWHAANAELVGSVTNCYGYLYSTLHRTLCSNEPPIERLRKEEIHETKLDSELKKRYATLRREVEKTYGNVAANVSNLANAKLGLEYLKELGFDLADLLAQEERPVETALAVPVNTDFLLIMQKEENNESETV